MVICLKKTRVIYIVMVAIIAMFIFEENVYGTKWQDLDSQKSEIIQYADTKNEDEIVEVCKYIQKGKRVDYPSDDIQERYLFIYTDNTATVGWNASGTTNTNNESTGYGKAIDGYRETPDGTLYRGVRNWSANKGKNNGNDGVVVSSSDSKDAYSTYKSSGNCPAYIAERENGTSHFFWVSVGSSGNDYDNMIKWINDDKKGFGTDHKYYFNTPIVSSDIPNISDGLVCNYVKQGSDGDGFTITFNSVGPSDISNNQSGISDVYYNSSLFSTEYLKRIESGKCPKAIKGCSNTETGSDGIDFNQLEITGDTSNSINENFCKDGRFNNQKKVDFECTGDNCSAKSICKETQELYDGMKDKLVQYNSVDRNSSEARSILNEYNILKSNYNAVCSSILKVRDYSVGTCFDDCLKLSEKIAELETDNGLRSTYGNEKCNIGEQVVAMVYNILKWAKYIAPVLVIILTILDFIKALAAQSDDDMKKAQGKFIKRLIVAALLFLLPLIINFALKTFGFYSSSCDITDLF